jgi:YHS domain-containing protein
MQINTQRYCRLMIAAVSLLLVNLAFAADPDIFEHRKKGAIKGADAVAYWSLPANSKAIRGSDEYRYEWRGAVWKFANAQNLAMFKADPEKYAPEFGGYCAFAVSHGFTKSVDPDRWDIVDGKLYLNYNGIAQRKWRKDQDLAIVRGHKNWPEVLTACEQHNNCRENP